MPPVSYFEKDLGPEEVRALNAFTHLAGEPMVDAGTAFISLIHVFAELEPRLTLTQKDALLAAGGIVASAVAREFEIAKFKGE